MVRCICEYDSSKAVELSWASRRHSLSVTDLVACASTQDMALA